MDITKIKPYEKNAKKHPPEQVKLIASSIRDFGWQSPIKLGEDYTIIVGHGRFQAYQEYQEQFKLKEPWVIDETGKTISGELEPRKLTNLEERDYRLRDNKIAESDWDGELLIPELKELEGLGLDISLMGFNRDLIIEPDAKDDLVPGFGGTIKSSLGDLYVLGNHRLLCGDSAKVEDTEKLMAGRKADMVFTDPPWNVDYGNTPKDNAQGYKVRTIMNDNMGEDFIPFLKSVFALTAAFSKGGAAAYVVMSAQEWGGMMEVMRENGYHWSSTIIWKKDRLVMSRKDYHTQYEPIWYGWLDGSRIRPVEDRKQSDVWDIPRPSDSPLHPTTKPIALIERAIMNSSKNEDIILEQFCGSGSTIIAAEKTGRYCYAMELDPKYVDVIVQRYVDFTGNETVYRNGDEIEWKKSADD